MASPYISLSILLHIISSFSLAQSINNGAGAGAGGVTIDLIHRDSPLSPSHDPSKTRFERLRDASHRSLSRQSSLNQTPQAPLAPNGGEYLIEYQIGTPPVRQLSILDTGSDLTWIQCKPCTKCYNQNYPLFDPASSARSYRPVACQTNECAYSGKSVACINNICQYGLSYKDNSFSSGELATDTLILSPTASFPKFAFGCGRSNGGSFKPTASGVFGLGNGAISLINQAAASTSFHRRFSYCLTSPITNVSSKISFGNNAVFTGPNALSTPLVTKETDTFYHLTLQGVTVGSQRFEYKSSDEEEGGEGNIIIDSGTTLTFVPSELYRGIETALVNEINGTRVNDPHPRRTFILCYKLPSKGELVTPRITAHFKGADVVLPQGTTFVEVEKGVVCLTILPVANLRSQNVAIFGNLHQVDYLIGYDLLKKQVNFLKTDCSKPR